MCREAPEGNGDNQIPPTSKFPSPTCSTLTLLHVSWKKKLTKKPLHQSAEFEEGSRQLVQQKTAADK